MDPIDSLLGQIRQLERALAREVQRKEVEFFYKIRQKKIRFTEEARASHKKLAKRIHRYVLDSRFLVILTGPLIWLCLFPLVALDIVASLYQAISFPSYGIPKIRRADYFAMDRHHLAYLNAVEKLNCTYCAYANGLLGYLVEMAARTEQYWCPIKHALRIHSIHSRYKHFFDYGDAEGYRERIESVRRAFEDAEEAPAGNGDGERAPDARNE